MKKPDLLELVLGLSLPVILIVGVVVIKLVNG